MEAIEVKLRQGLRKEIDPASFTCKGRTYHIVSIGRRWEGAKSEHMLVMDAQSRAYHIFYVREDAQWYWLPDNNNPTSTPM
ncbi:MAG: hypothetical protein IZT55_02030 [Anaerolineae bacterium]|nr:hypothetical protein [Anaerolineae bacterium]